ncbi:hypothetical protein [Erwinia mallotivora]|uniref:hypothetical protein n=1 Tax=Erwinia mallotivora TaxID=69222 RepID=UPI001267997E|nr:hypothetical protein [Erwinia mallotivora]
MDIAFLLLVIKAKKRRKSAFLSPAGRSSARALMSSINGLSGKKRISLITVALLYPMLLVIKGQYPGGLGVFSAHRREFAESARVPPPVVR